MLQQTTSMFIIHRILNGNFRSSIQIWYINLIIFPLTFLIYFLCFTECNIYQVPSSYSGFGQGFHDVLSDTGLKDNMTDQHQYPTGGPEPRGPYHHCLSCGKVYTWKSNLQRHIRAECGKQPNMQCPYCPFITNRKTSLQKHIFRRHKDMPNIQVIGALFVLCFAVLYQGA